MKVYLAGPLFSASERAWLDQIARTLRSEGIQCFVPHEIFAGTAPGSAIEIYEVDRAGMEECDALLAWLDGPGVDDGTAVEIGIFTEWVRDGRKRGIVGYCTDLRQKRSRAVASHGGLNLFVAGAIQTVGTLCWSLDDALDAIRQLATRQP
jgi:nucleoside 2-deoxyribosyltransferase